MVLKLSYRLELCLVFVLACRAELTVDCPRRFPLTVFQTEKKNMYEEAASEQSISHSIWIYQDTMTCCDYFT